MSEIINHIIFQRNTISKNNHFLCVLKKLDLLTDHINISNTSSLKKEIKCNNILKKEEKNDDKNIIHANFNYILNNLLNILNKNEIKFNTKAYKIIQDKNIKKKIIDINRNNSSINLNFFLKNIFQIKKIRKCNQILLKKKLNKIKENTNNIQENNKIYKLNNVKKIKNLQLSKIRHKSFQDKIHLFTEKNNLLHNDKKMIFPLDFKITKNDLDLSKIDNKIYNYTFASNILHKEEFKPLNIQQIVLKSSNNFIEWKNLINKKILLLISNNNNQAEINLKPESLGPISIIMDMKNSNIILQFIATHNKSRILLNKCIPFLYNNLQKTGVKLEQCNIFSSFENYINNNYKNSSNKNINKIQKFQKKINIYENTINVANYKRQDWYV